MREMPFQGVKFQKCSGGHAPEPPLNVHFRVSMYPPKFLDPPLHSALDLFTQINHFSGTSEWKPYKD